jgi:hypothetical protein
VRLPAQTGIEDEMVRFWRKIAGERGQALVETALAVPLLLIIVLGVVYLSKAYNYKNDMTHLSNEAARYATVNYDCGTPGCIEPLVKSDAESQYLRDNVTVSICFDDPAYPDGFAHPAGGRVKAIVTLPGYQVLPNFLGFFGISKTLEADATMYQEQAYPGSASGHYNATKCP